MKGQREYGSKGLKSYLDFEDAIRLAPTFTLELPRAFV